MPDDSGESETIVVSVDALSNDEAFEMVRNIVGDKELSGSIFKQFTQPYISNPRAIAKHIDPPEEEIRELKSRLSLLSWFCWRKSYRR